MTTLALLAITLTSIVSSKQLTKTATATPDKSSDDLSITLSGDYVAVEDVTIDGSTTSAWKIWTPQRDIVSGGVEYKEYDETSDEYKASQTGMNMNIKVDKTYSFDKNQKSSIVITIYGKLETEDEGDMILAFSNTSATEYFASMIRLDNDCSNDCDNTKMLVYPACSSTFAEGNVVEVADGSRKERIHNIVCPKQYNGEYYCSKVGESITNGFPVTVTITNYPRSGQSQYIYTSSSGDSVDCEYHSAFEGNNGFQFYIAGEGVNGPSEIFYISKISVSKESCNNRPEWRSTYRNTGILSLEDPCYDGTNFKFQMDTLTEYTSSSDTTGTVSEFTNGGQWTNSGQYSTNSQYGDDGISARINKYTNGVFEFESVIFMAEGTVNGVSVVMGTMKYGIYIDNGFSDTAADDATLKVCVGITANDVEEEQKGEWEDASLYTLANDAFKLQNEKTATCTSTDGGDTNIDVIAERDGSVLCYTFNKCVGKITYDPFVYYEGEEEESVAIRYGGFGFIGCIVMAIYAFF